jgi:hypothetical protein
MMARIQSQEARARSFVLKTKFVFGLGRMAYLNINQKPAAHLPREPHSQDIGHVGGQSQRYEKQEQSLPIVEKILTSFKEGKRDSYDFRIHLHGKYFYIAYYAIRDKNDNYLGTIEVTQDITQISGLSGEKRLIDEKF